MEGQLWTAERELLYDTVRQYQPSVVFESGTWKGGGSTWQIVSALQANKKGHLYTCEIDIASFNIARDLYDGNSRVSLFNRVACDVLSDLVRGGIVPSVAFLDGSEDPQVTLDEFLALDRVMSPGSVVLVHDWDLGVRADGNVSTKCGLLRPILEGFPAWKIDTVLYMV